MSAGYADTAGELHGPGQAAPYIFRDDGELVWSGYGYYSIWAAPRRHTGMARTLRAGNHKLSDKQEFHAINEETALIQIYQPVPADLTPWGASPEQQRIVDAIIQGILEHVSPDEAILPINPGQAGSGYNSSDAWDYFRINSVDKDSVGNYLISARDACSVHKINGSTGEAIWRLGGVKSDFELGDNVKFCFQHHARFVSKEGSKEVISLYDNAAHGTEHGHVHEVHAHPLSQATAVQAFQPPDGLLSKSQGSTQLLPNGNVLVNWGSEGALTEYRADGTPIFHTYMDSGFLGLGVENYRGFRYNWTGLPNEAPAIVSLENDKGTTVYASWNSDTEIKLWHFFHLVDGYGSRQLLGEVERKGFETSLFVKDRGLGLVAAEAVGPPSSSSGPPSNAPTYILYGENGEQVPLGAEKSR
ncbi:ASST-domain-containing protein [Aspergillus falconensis]